jgi:hypothetical protein
MIRRSLVIVSLASLALGVAPGAANAVSPARGCPPAFQGPWTAQHVIDEFPPPPGFPDPEGAILSFDKNGDLRVCVMGLPNGRIDVIDNAANVG